MITCREALSTPGFTHWLVRNFADHASLDYSNPADEERIVKWFLARVACREAAPLMRQMYREMFLGDIGLCLSNSILGSVEKYLDRLAIENPEGAAYYCERAKRWHEIPREIQRLTEEYAQAGGEGRRDQASLDLASTQRDCELRKRVGRFLPLWRSAEEKEVMQYPFGALESSIQTFKVELNRFAQIEQQIPALQKERWDLKREFLTVMDIVKELLVEIRMEVSSKLIEMVSRVRVKKDWRDRSVEELEVAQSYLEKMQAAGAEFGLDYLADIDNVVGFQKNLDDAISRSLYEDLKKRMVAQNKQPASVALPAVENLINQALARTQLGSLRDYQAREAVVKTLQDLHRDGAISGAHKLLFRPMAR
ncbi:MAG: hypothetical protein G01um10143_469 [Parcubacteria group bacterium Gr01-1014_3]|nr:MAG: hypothetical protein G01um10143_469 [Parcubacteria group bacterium Gr01-1014_3]